VPSFSFCETFLPSQARRIFMPVRLHGVGTDRSAAIFVKRGSPNPRAVSAHTGDLSLAQNRPGADRSLQGLRAGSALLPLARVLPGRQGRVPRAAVSRAPSATRPPRTHADPTLPLSANANRVYSLTEKTSATLRRMESCETGQVLTRPFAWGANLHLSITYRATRFISPMLG
jgi:hypothetical protein